MRKATLSLVAAAAVQFVNPAQAAIIFTDYLIGTSPASSSIGSFSLAFDDATSVYSLSSFNLDLSTNYGLSDVGVADFGPNALIMGATINGLASVFPPDDDFAFLFDPMAASQIASLFSFTVSGIIPISSGDVVINQTGSAGTVTQYSISGGPASGSFSLEFVNSTSVYLLTSLSLVLGTNYGLSDVGVADFGPNTLILGGTINGLASVFPSSNDFAFVFDPMAASQTTNPSYSFLGTIPQSGAWTITQVGAPPHAVPEPTSWALMLTGFGLVGAAMRRRTRHVSSEGFCQINLSMANY